jgi:hypothetical protein
MHHWKAKSIDLVVYRAKEVKETGLKGIEAP